MNLPDEKKSSDKSKEGPFWDKEVLLKFVTKSLSDEKSDLLDKLKDGLTQKEVLEELFKSKTEILSDEKNPSLDKLKQARCWKEVVWMFFRYAYLPGSKDIYVFFEGKDDLSFYLPFLRRYWDQKGAIKEFYCNGKDEVIAIIPKVKQSLDNKWRGLFFLDKDLEDYCTAPRESGDFDYKADGFVYITEVYSIENFLVSSSTLSIIWTDLFKLLSSDPRLEEIKKAFSYSYDTFCEAMKSIMAWVIHLRRSGHKVNLSGVNEKKLIQMDQDCKCTFANDWANHILAASNLQDRVTYDKDAQKKVEDEIRSDPPKNYIRGKFELWFFVEFLKKNHNFLKEEPFDKYAVNGRNLFENDSGAIDLLSARIQIPESLKKFLDDALPS